MDRKAFRDIPLKNYIILGGILLVTFGLAYYIYLWFQEYQADRLEVPIMNEVLLQINNNEVDNYIMENKDVVIYASLLSDEKTRKFEERFKNIITRYQLRDEIIYLDCSKIEEKLRDKYHLKDINYPLLLVFKGGILNDSYSIYENNFSVDRVLNYLKYKNIIEVL